MTLASRLAAEIAAEGPITVAQFMLRCLHDPMEGYYATRPGLGEAGDFITAPLISQMFGELIGLWLVEAWRRLGSPDHVVLAEAGPGDGTLMADVLRVVRLAPEMKAACELVLIETSRPLRQAQAKRLEAETVKPRWIEGLDQLPAGPLLFVANEFLDCLPARQFVRGERGWAERLVGSTDGKTLSFGLAAVSVGAAFPEAPVGSVLEISAPQAAVGSVLGAHLAEHGGYALLIDYGRHEPGFGDTLQALKAHEKVDPLASAGAADLTVHADFPAVLAAAEAGGAQVDLMTQGEFLHVLGLASRAAALSAENPRHADQIARQVARLTAPDQMGDLFKVAAIWNAPPPPAFEEAP